MKLIFFLLFVLFSTHLFAGILIEPQLGFKFAGSADTSAHGNSVAYKYSTLDYGARLGYQEFGLMTGVSFNKSSFSKDAATASVSPTSTTVDVDQTSIGVFAGYNLPILFRAWIGYNFSVTEKASQSVSNYSTSGDKWTGSSVELGAGFTGLPFLSLNAIYRMVNYSKFYNAFSGATSSSSSYKPNEFEIAISAPFNL